MYIHIDNWTILLHAVGQGHKDWCGIPYGEEDLDWTIAEIDGKGQGIVSETFYSRE